MPFRLARHCTFRTLAFNMLSHLTELLLAFRSAKQEDLSWRPVDSAFLFVVYPGRSVSVVFRSG